MYVCGKQSVVKQYVQTMAIYNTVRDSAEYITCLTMDGKVAVHLNLSAICSNNAIEGELPRAVVLINVRVYTVLTYFKF